MATTTRNHLRRARNAWRLSQRELVELIGLRDRSILSRIENGDVHPTYRQFICLSIIFGLSPADLFPAFYDDLEERVMRNAADLLTRLERRTSEAACVKRKLLHTIARRAANAFDA